MKGSDFIMGVLCFVKKTKEDHQIWLMKQDTSVLLGHEQLATTMRYLDISTDDQIKAMATLEDENDSKVSAKWKNNNGSLKSLVARQ